MNLYLDTSILVALFTKDPFTERADSFLEKHPSIVNVSDFAAAEFASAVARQVRAKEISSREARAAFSTFDAWISRAAQRSQITPSDIIAAEVFLRRLDLPLRAPDAVHIAITQRIGAALATFDARMSASARTLGTEVAKT